MTKNATVEKTQIERLIEEAIEKIWELWDLDDVHQSLSDQVGMKATAQIEVSQRLVPKIELQVLEEISKEIERLRVSHADYFESYRYALDALSEFLERKMNERKI